MTEQQVIDRIMQTYRTHGLKEIFLKSSKTEKICMAAVSKSGLMLEYVENQSEEMCLVAVKNDREALQFVKNQTEKICIESIRASAHSFQYVKEQTEEVCVYAVARNPVSLQLVKNQTPRICLAAMNAEYDRHIAYCFVKIVDNPNYDVTMKNLIVLQNKEDFKQKVKRL